MGFLDTLLGRSKPVRPNLDVLFAVPSATLTLEASAGFAPTGAGSVCFKNPEGMAAEQAEQEIGGLLSLDPASSVRISVDEFGFTWVTCRRADGDVSALVTDLHGVNTATRRGARSGWSTCTSEAASTRSRRPSSAGGTPNWSCGCEVCWTRNFPSSPTLADGSRCGTPPASDPYRQAVCPGPHHIR
jgi:hypothetical protein